MNSILIFIDGLSYNNSKKLKSLNDLYSFKITPGAGFSNNIYAELVCGRNPDEMNYFNEWEFYPQKKTLLFKFLGLFDFFRKYKYLNYGYRKFLKFFGIISFNIPFKYINLFKQNPPHNFQNLPTPNFPLDNNFVFFDSALVQKKVGCRDKIIFENVMSSSHEKIFISFVDLDNISHIYGVDSVRYNNHVKKLDDYIISIRNNYPSHSVSVFSDHGMSNILETFNFNVEKILGPSSLETYSYFLDSTFLRIWIHDNKYEHYLELLSAVDKGHIISSVDRKLFGITNSKFGNIIFRANDGLMFVPNFFGFRACKSMHGYDSNLESQKAFFATNIKSKFLPKTSIDVNKFFYENLS